MTGSRAAYVRDAAGVLAAIGELIDAAEQSIVLQMYLFAANGQLALVQPRAGAEAHAGVVCDWLIAKRRRHPGMPIVVVLDSNTPDDPARVIDGSVPLVSQRLREAGIAVVVANLFHNRFDAERRFPASCRFHRDGRDTPAEAWVPAQQRWQVLHNVEDHRKNLVIDGGAAALVTSHNLIDVAFDWHENGFVLAGDAARTVFAQAQVALARALELPQRLDDRARAAVAALATTDTPSPVPHLARALVPTHVTVLADAEIRARFEHVIDTAGAGDALDLATAYFSDLPLWERLVAAAERGARVRVLVDDLVALPLPRLHGAVVRHLANRAVLDRARVASPPGLEVRVFHSGAGAMMHLKTLIARGREPVVIGGQCNATPNSFSGAWTETDVEVRGCDAIVAAATAHFEELWTHRDCAPLPPPGRWFRTRRTLAATALAAFALLGLTP